MSRDAIEKRMHKHASKAAASCSSITKKRVSPHVLRHTRAVRMLEAGLDSAVIALWLGHESVETTHVYLAEPTSPRKNVLWPRQLQASRPPVVTDLPTTCWPF